jgi:hypothetical protein
MVFFSFNLVHSQDKGGLLKYLEAFRISAYVDAYYGWNTDKNSPIRLFDGMEPVRDEMRLNIAAVSLKYETEKIRGAFALQYGDYVKYNWLTANPNIQEANVGFNITKGLWVDAGYFLTHVGPESILKDNFVSSYSLPTYYEPLYQSGIKVTYNINDKISTCLHLLNGYNVIEDNNKNKSVGLQLNYQLNQFVKLTYNNVIGNEQPSPLPGKTRILNNFIVNYGCPCIKWDAILSGEIGTQENSKLSDPTATAYTYGGMVSVRYRFNNKFSTTLRGDYYQDLDGVYSGIVANNSGIKGNGLTLGFEYKPVEAAYVRLETRYLSLDGNQKIFYDNTNARTDVTLSCGFTY